MIFLISSSWADRLAVRPERLDDLEDAGFVLVDLVVLDDAAVAGLLVVCLADLAPEVVVLRQAARAASSRIKARACKPRIKCAIS
jgi:hypothetical protein